MWRNYLLVAFRVLAKNRTYAAINIAGLALGLAACSLILLYVRYETSYDGWRAGADRAFQVQTRYHATPRGGEDMNLQMSGVVVGRALRKDYPQQVEKLVWVRGFSPIVIQDGQAGTIKDFRMADGNLFDVLPVPFVRGSAATALPDPRSIALSESEAKRRFGSADPIGRTLTLAANAGNIDYRVTAVFRDLPGNTVMPAEAVARFDLDSEFADRPQSLTSWNNQQGWNFVRLRSPADAALIAANMPAWEKRNIPNDVSGGERTNPGDYQDYRLVNLRDVHLGEAQDASLSPGNDRFTVATFAVVALLVLGMACVNFTNLATARASQRAREVALRKVLGASRRQLVVQLLGEAIMVAGVAMLLALALVELALPAFNGFLDAQIDLRYWGRDGVLPPLLALVAAVGLLAGLYPALYLARFEPARILKANKSAADAQGSGRLRSALVVAQFAVSIGLIICTAVIYAQTRYARTVDAGYRRDGLFQVENLGFKGVTREAVRGFVEQARRVPGVRAAVPTQIALAPGNNSVTRYALPGSPAGVELGTYAVGEGFFGAMGMKLLAGRDFSRAIGRDDATTPFPVDPAAERALVARGLNVVVSAAAVRRLGFATPQAAIGKEIRGGLANGDDLGDVPATIVGVVGDARFRSVREPLQPIVYLLTTDNFSQVVVRFAGVAPTVLRDRMRDIWTRLVPQVPFGGRFADEVVARQYRQETARGQLFAAFAILSVVIGCLGLFGLAAFTAERRTKEIGIRKVLGARTRDIVRLLVWQFTKPVVVANLIAWPVAWWVMRRWLNGFEARIHLGPAPFLLAGALALAIAVATIAGHAMRVARQTPIRALRYE